ncbi:MAG: hypothetical protein U0797_02770 [Gemmataceae bacterium]
MLVAAVGMAAAGNGYAEPHSSRQPFGGSTRTSPTTYVSSPFRLGNLFPSLNPFSNRTNVGRSTIPNPNSPDYLKAFGYKKLY